MASNSTTPSCVDEGAAGVCSQSQALSTNHISCSRKCPSCADCSCGENCQCTETLCRCQASSVLNSLERDREAQWKIEGMTCQSCVHTVKSVLGRDSQVSLSEATARVEVESQNHAAELTRELNDAGFKATLESVSNALVAPASPPGLQLSSPVSPKPSCSFQIIEPKSLLESPESRPPMEDPLAPQPPSVYPMATNPSQSHPTKQIVEIIVGGMTCSMCSKSVTRALEGLDGVLSVKVNLATDLATVEHRGVAVEVMKEAIEDTGYDVTDIISALEHGSKLERMTKRQQEQVAGYRRAFLFSLLGSVPIFALTMIAPHVLPAQSNIHHWLSNSISVLGCKIQREAALLWIMATPVQFGSGFSFYKSSYFGLQTGQLGMDVLIALGTSASYGYAASETLAGRDGHFFETSAVLLSFVLLGKWMNSFAVRRTSDALAKLMKLQAKVATRILPRTLSETTLDPTIDPYDEETVPTEQIQPNDIVKILRGGSIPADGVVSHGEMTVDESMITGESVPVLKSPGSIVLGGTVCVEGSSAFVSVTGVGSSTALARIVQLVDEAQTRQVPIQSLADTISSVFVPAVCTLSVLTYMVWYALCMTGVVPEAYYAEDGAGSFSLMFGMACLVISCPCALGLAAPTAVMVGFGVGASHGVLMKGGEALETASKVDSVVFDKTGTLTQSKPTITNFILLPDAQWDKDNLLWYLASLERNSEHPLATAVVSHARLILGDTFLSSRPFTQPSEFRALTGRGASGVIENVSVAAGNRAFARLANITLSEEVEVLMAQLEREGKTAILAALNGIICAVMGIADQLKPDAIDTIRHLQDVMDVDVWMVTGDNHRTASAIAHQLGIPQERVVSEALPVAKVQKVKSLQKEGRVVAMVGDGINDSPALAQADVGMSLGTGAEIAAEASDMVLVRGHVSDVCTALNLSQVIFRRIKWNFLWSLLYNCLGIPVAAGVFYPLVHSRLPPTLAGLAMALSSLSVVCSSLALRLYTPPCVSVCSRPRGILHAMSYIADLGLQAAERIEPEPDSLTQSLLPEGNDISGIHRGGETASQAHQLEEGRLT